MILSDRTIREELAAGPHRDRPARRGGIQPLVGRPAPRPLLPGVPQPHDGRHRREAEPRGRSPSWSRSADDEPFILHPGEFVLGSTLERVALPDDLVGRLEGKSSLGRLGLLIHSTAGFVDAGWDGQLTLELSNVANLPITLYPA